MGYNSPIVVFSHLRWDFVFQRPQHLLSRLARSRDVIYIEEPVSGDAPGWQRHRTDQAITVYRPALPGPVKGFHHDHYSSLLPLVRSLAEREQCDQAIGWLYTPLALPLARALSPAMLVYDCMDELSLFHGAPVELRRMEADLLAEADLVFTGGPSLYNAKKDRHPDVHCFPSSVDADHFRQACPGGGGIEEADAQRAIPSPRLGFYGVIDERLDLELLDTIARTRPEWQIILVGPVVKIDPASLPRHPNIHYFGQQQYEDLPRFLAGWDVCLLPFALNEATRFISPTKTLEYMAAERPIVSTPIRDVEEPYGEIVFIGRTAEEFIAGIEAALTLTPSRRRDLVGRMQWVVAHTSWERTTERMQQLIEHKLPPRAAVTGGVKAVAPAVAETISANAGVKV